MPVISLDHSSSEPKYMQIANSIIKSIDNNQLKIGDKISSVNEVCEEVGIAKKTVVQAFDQLKQAGIIYSVKYKGYFVASRNTRTKHNIFILFNTLTAYKEKLYESIKESLGGKGVVDIYFHHDKVEVFNTLIEKSAGKYTDYIIMPMDNRGINKSMQLLPADKVFILDLGYNDWGKKYPSVCQYFEEDIYEALKNNVKKIKKYRKIVLVLGKSSLYNLKFTQKGLGKFCREFGMDWNMTEQITQQIPVKGELYIVIADVDLVELVKKSKKALLRPGKDIGIISYNETPFKEIVGDGIATISTDFSLMGKNIIDLVVNKKKDHVKNPCMLSDKKSF